MSPATGNFGLQEAVGQGSKQFDTEFHNVHTNYRKKTFCASRKAQF